MATPTRRDIEERARELFREDARHATGEVPTEPEVHELKESGYFAKARRELMTTDSGANTRRQREAEEVGEQRVQAREMSDLLEAKMARTREKMAKGPSTKERVSGLFGGAKARLQGATSGARSQLGEARKEIGGAARAGGRAFVAGARKGYLEETRIANERAKARQVSKKEYRESYSNAVHSGIKSVARREGRRRGRAIAETRLHPPKRQSLMDYAGISGMGDEGALLSIGSLGGGGGLERMVSMPGGLSIGRGSLGESPLAFLSGGAQKHGKGKKTSSNMIDDLLL